MTTRKTFKLTGLSAALLMLASGAHAVEGGTMHRKKRPPRRS